MSVTSLQFFCLFLLSIGIYYLIPKKFQWYALLLFSICFFCLSSPLFTGVYLLITIFSTTVCARTIDRNKQWNQEKEAKRALILGVILNVGMLCILKYSNFFISNFNMLTWLLHKPFHLELLHFMAPLGISFYTLQAIGYLFDTYWGISEVQNHLFKTALFIGYYPQITSGPIARYHEVSGQLYEEHLFDWKNVTFGLQRMLWGIFKKIVISARLSVLVDTIYGNTAKYGGFYIWFASFSFLMQLYTDFSGCMDIILGVSECYGILLPENFRTPFFSRSVQEFWQRWHITLGAWLKDYILYPILRSKNWRKLTKWIKNHFGKKAAKQLPAYLGMLCVWFLMGLWHGGKWKFILGEGMWFFLCIVTGQLLEPVFQKLIALFQINTTCFSWHLFQSIRVFLLVSIGNMFFRIDSFMETIKAIRIGFSKWNPEIFFNGALLELGLGKKDFFLTFLCLILLLLVSIYQQKESVREWLSRQNLVFRWMVLLTLIFAILLFGKYGPGYDAKAFIYEAF